MLPHSKSNHHMLEQPSWSSQSASPSPPPPLPPPVAARWARAEQQSADSCPHCRGRLASIPTRTTSLNSNYTGCKDRTTTPVLRPPDDEDSFPVLCDRELHSLHRNVPALRRRDVDTATIKQHYYPEGGWGWLVCGAAFLAHLLTSGMQLAFGLLYLYIVKDMEKKFAEDKEFYTMAAAWMGALCLCVSFLASPIVVAICRRKSTRLTSVFGGLILALSCLFASFATQFHQAVLSYGVFMGTGAGIVRETSGIMLGHYFKRRREFVEMVAQTGCGIGVALFSVLYKEAVGKLGWRLGLQAVTGLLVLAFFLPIIYRSANLYHPQRRAITHLKNQRKKMKEKKTHVKDKKPPMFDFSPLKSRGLRVLLLASGTGALGIYAPIFYLAFQGFKEGLEDSALVILQTFFGFASALGCVGFGILIMRPTRQCTISRQYLTQTAMLGTGFSLLAMSAVQGYHGYVLFVWMYGVFLGGYTYALKMFTLERIKARHYTKAWSFVQGACALPVLIGIPITGYVNQCYPKAGYYYCFLMTVVGASLLFLVGTKKDPHDINHQPHPLPPPSTNNTATATNNYTVNHINECNCHLHNTPYTNVYMPYYYRSPGRNYEPIHSSYTDYDRGSLHRQHSLRHRSVERLPNYVYLPKSMSYAANIECPLTYANCHQQDYAQYYNRYYHHPHLHARSRYNLRPSKSVPEGLARTEFYGSYRRPIVRNVHLIEQITTSV